MGLILLDYLGYPIVFLAYLAYIYTPMFYLYGFSPVILMLLN